MPEPTIGELQAEIQSLTAERDKWKALSRKNEEAKNTALSDLQAANTAHAQALTDARAEARSEALRESAEKVALTAFKAAANGRLSDVDTVLKTVDVKQFATDSGEADDKAIAAFLDGIAPATKQPETPSHDALFAAHGARKPSPGGGLDLNGDPLFQKVAAALGIPDAPVS